MKLLRFLFFLPVALGVLVSTFSVAPEAQAAGGESGLRWAKNTVYVENHAPSMWPVWAAAEKMDNGSALNLVTVNRCPAGSQCIKVYGKASLPGRQVGYAWRQYAGTDMMRSRIVLDNGYGRNHSYSRRKNIVMHEIGHAVGLNHSDQRHSLMYHICSSRTGVPTTDLRQLQRRYK